MNKKMTAYEAPKGKVFDYKEPHSAGVLELDGTITVEEEHLYAKYLYLGPRDTIDNYILVDDPKEKK